MRLVPFKSLGPEKGIHYCRDHVRRLVKAGKFPRPIQIGDGRIAWLETELDELIAKRVAERDEQMDAGN